MARAWHTELFERAERAAHQRVFRVGLPSLGESHAKCSVRRLSCRGARGSGSASRNTYQAADVYAPPPTVYVAPSTTYAQPPAVVGAPMVQSQVYLAPNTTYVAPGTVYDDQAVYMNGQRYYRDCWWDWGRRRCELKPWW